ncbi:hypothetical protein [Paracoccus marcusii]|uniref:hypothetical protein n=1 Tax=Paracoccus marcusii TaxID=59779 RepID=UPI002ED52226
MTGRHPRVLQIQTGTALCARITDGQNEFVLLEIDGSDLRLERHVAPMDAGDFGAPRSRITAARRACGDAFRR